MNVRPVESRDQAAVRDVLLAAFPGPDEAKLVEQLRADGDAAIELVAEIGNRIVGHILFSPVQAPFRALAFAPLAVAPGRQRRGIGAALIDAGHQLAREQDWQAIFVVGEPEYYRRFGYDARLAAGFDSPYAGDHFMLLSLSGGLPATEGVVTHAPAFAHLS